jgi:hypothetical protein
MKFRTVLILLTALLLPALSAHAYSDTGAEDLPISQIESHGEKGTVSITVGTFENSQAEIAAERISRLIGQEVEASSGAMDLELGSVLSADPVMDFGQESIGFLSRLKQKLGANAQKVKRQVTLRLPIEHVRKLKSKSVGWIANSSPNTWLWIRIGSNTGIATGAFLFLGRYPFMGAMAAGLSILMGTTVTANLAVPMNDFQNFTRFWNRTKLGTEIEKGKLEKDFKMIALDEVHGLANYGILEIIFTSAVVGLRTGTLVLLQKAHLLNMTIPSFQVSEFLQSFAWTMVSQMIWDRGAGSLKSYLKLKGYSNEAIERIRIPYMAIGSVLSVSSFTIMQGIDPLIGKIGLGTLGASGVAITGYFESKVARAKARLSGTSICSELAESPSVIE